MDLTKSYDFFQPEMLKGRVHIIGCGSVGSTVAENLVRFGIKNITLYDFDKVEEHNIVNQMFTQDDVGKYKVDAVAQYITMINPEVSIEIEREGWKGQRLAGYVFLCCDSIELRKQIVNENKANSYIKGMFDFRTRLTDAQHYAADWSKTDMISNFLESMNFSHDDATEETPMSACRIPLSVATTIRMVVACGVSNFINFVKNGTLKKVILIDAFNFSVDAF